jgi:hypothetical protein
MNEQGHRVIESQQEKAAGKNLNSCIRFLVQGKDNGDPERNGNWDMVGEELKNKSVETVKINHTVSSIFLFRGIS